MLENEYPKAYEVQPERQLYDHPHAPVISVGEWLISLILLSIPIVNIVVIIMWMMDANANPNRANFAKALIIIILIQVLLVALFFGMLAGMMGSLATLINQSGY